MVSDFLHKSGEFTMASYCSAVLGGKFLHELYWTYIRFKSFDRHGPGLSAYRIHDCFVLLGRLG